MNIEEIATETVNSGFQVYKEIGPGLLESVHEAILTEVLRERGLQVERQKPIPIVIATSFSTKGFARIC